MSIAPADRALASAYDLCDAGIVALFRLLGREFRGGSFSMTFWLLDSPRPFYAVSYYLRGVWYCCGRSACFRPLMSLGKSLIVFFVIAL